MTLLELLVDLNLDSPRQGPGSEAETLRALSYITIDKATPIRVADIGCGSGAQTLILAQNLNAKITAVDLFPAFLKKLEQHAISAKLENKIETVKADMADLPFENESLDIIWSEGAIYNLGFEAGIKNWDRFLKPGGYMVLSEITWLNDSRPEEIDKFWTSEYPEIDTTEGKIATLEKNGYKVVGHFNLVQESWINNYYKPLEERFDLFLEKHDNSELAQQVIDMQKQEIELYKKFKDEYSYGFYVAQKTI